MIARSPDNSQIIDEINSTDFAVKKHALLFIGASLSEPHTSVTALGTCVCMFALCAWTDHLQNERIQIFHEDRYRA